MPFDRYFQTQAFDADATTAMCAAFEEALTSACIADRNDPLAELIAHKIMQLYRLGEHDPLMRKLFLLLTVSLALASCGDQQPGPKGDRGDVGPAGPAGLPGSPSAGSQIRMIRAPCNDATCIAECNPDERILNAYATNPGGVITYANEQSATFNPRRRPAILVVACIKK